MTEDYYTILGIAKNFTYEDLKKTYHKLAKKFHPDKNLNNPKAEEIFKKINNAYETLKDPVKKQLYDLSQPDILISNRRDTSQTNSTSEDKNNSESHTKNSSTKHEKSHKYNWSNLFSKHGYSKKEEDEDVNFDFSEFFQESPRNRKQKKQKSSFKKPPWNSNFTTENDENKFKNDESNRRASYDDIRTDSFKFWFGKHYEESLKFSRNQEHNFLNNNNNVDDAYDVDDDKINNNAEYDYRHKKPFFECHDQEGVPSADPCVECQYCGLMLDVEQLIVHQPTCVYRKARNINDVDNDEYNDNNPDAIYLRRWMEWRGVHVNTLNSIRRDKRQQKLRTENMDIELDEKVFATSQNPDLLRCPYCYRTFNRRAAQSHVPFCRTKCQESGGRAPNPLGKHVNSDYASKAARAKEYAKKIYQQQHFGVKGRQLNNDSDLNSTEKLPDISTKAKTNTERKSSTNVNPRLFEREKSAKSNFKFTPSTSEEEVTSKASHVQKACEVCKMKYDPIVASFICSHTS